MRLPSKVTSYGESSICKIPILLKILKDKNLSPYELYTISEKYFECIEEFIDALDCLYALNKVIYDEVRGILYVT